MKLLSSLLLLLTYISAALAADCQPVNLYNQENSPLRKMPIYDQDGDGLCYAYTTAQMVDYYNLRLNPEHKLTSANWVAFAHKYRNKSIMRKTFNRITSPRRMFGIAEPKRLGYSDINVAIKDLATVGVCDQETVQKGIESFKRSGKLNDDEFLYLFHLFHTKAKEVRREARKGQGLIDDKKIVAIFHEALDDLIEQRKLDIVDPLLTRPESELTPEELKIRRFKEGKIADLESLKSCDVTGTPDGDATELYQHMRAVFDFERRHKQLVLLRDHVFKDCMQEGAVAKVPVPKFKHVGEFFATNKKLLDEIDEALDDQKAPAAIGYCAKVLDNEGHEPPLRLGPHGFPPSPRVLQLTKSENVKKCSPHYSMVVGRREKAGSCQYMIRNTYGAHFWNTHMDCTCENKNKEQFDCTFKTHGDQDVTVLGCWINGGNLAESTFSVSHFK